MQTYLPKNPTKADIAYDDIMNEIKNDFVRLEADEITEEQRHENYIKLLQARREILLLNPSVYGRRAKKPSTTNRAGE